MVIIIVVGLLRCNGLTKPRDVSLRMAFEFLDAVSRWTSRRTGVSGRRKDASPDRRAHPFKPLQNLIPPTARDGFYLLIFISYDRNLYFLLDPTHSRLDDGGTEPTRKHQNERGLRARAVLYVCVYAVSSACHARDERTTTPRAKEPAASKTAEPRLPAHAVSCRSSQPPCEYTAAHRTRAYTSLYHSYKTSSSCQLEITAAFIISSSSSWETRPSESRVWSFASCETSSSSFKSPPSEVRTSRRGDVKKGLTEKKDQGIHRDPRGVFGAVDTVFRPESFSLVSWSPGSPIFIISPLRPSRIFNADGTAR